MYVRCSEASEDQETKEENKMSTELRPTTAEEYRELAARKRAEKPTEIVPLKSGSVFGLRRVDIQSYLIMGQCPTSVMMIGFRAFEEKQKRAGQKVNASGPLSVLGSLNGDEAAGLLIFMREVVSDCTVNPKFVEVANNPGEISASDMLPEDFSEIFAWAMAHAEESSEQVN